MYTGADTTQCIVHSCILKPPMPVHKPSISPALVAQESAQRLPRWALLLLCCVYAAAGFIGRQPWRGDDLTSLGYMLEMAQTANWKQPGLLGNTAHFYALLPYWLGAWAIRLCPSWLAPHQAVQLLFMGIVLLGFACAWYGMYYLARARAAQPVMFAFGGHAKPSDYARALADGGLLALLACLGLAEQLHTTTPVVVQFTCASMVFFALAAMPFHTKRAIGTGALGILGLVLSGAATTAILLSVLGLLVHAVDSRIDWLADSAGYERTSAELRAQNVRYAYGLIGITLWILLAVAVAVYFKAWRWRIQPLPTGWVGWRDNIRLQLWFFWPAWPFALWTLWRWRQQWRSILPARHIALPLGMVLIGCISSVLMGKNQAMLLMVLPTSAVLAAFALPTFKRSASAFIDWFSVLSFSLLIFVVWASWLLAVSGNIAIVQRLHTRLEGYQPHINWLHVAVALAVTTAWLALVRWRTSRLRLAMWKSMILPAGGVVMGWVLLSTLWLPAFNHIRSYQRANNELAAIPTLTKASCIAQYGLEDDQIAALRYYNQLPLQPAQRRGKPTVCDWLLVHIRQQKVLGHVLDTTAWQQVGKLPHAGSSSRDILVFNKRN